MILEELLNSLEKAASEQTAPAEQADKPEVSKELDALLGKEAAEENAKQAFEDGEKVARAVLEKLATDLIKAVPITEATQSEEKKQEAPVEKVAGATEKKAEAKTEAKQEIKSEEKDMNKEAQNSAKELATAILEKLALDAGPMVQNKPAPGVNKLHQDVGTMVAEDDAKVGPTPARSGTINQLFDAIVAKAKATSGAVGYDQVTANSSESSQAAAEGKDMHAGTPSIPPSGDIVDNAKVAEEKQAAVQALCEAGLEWEVAVDLVKQAAEEIEHEEIDQVKAAAVSELMKEGMDFDGAVDAVRQAIKDLVNGK